MSSSAMLEKEFAPCGKLRVALNHGNRVLVGRDPDGMARGISVDIAGLLSQELELGLEFVEFERAVDVSESATEDLWDVCFLAVDPKRAETIAFSNPYIRIEGCYLASDKCPANTSDELVDLGLPVGTVEGSAYTLTLSRKPGAENLVPFHDIFAMLDALDSGQVMAAAGIRQPMEAEAAKREGARVLFPPFMEIRQAMALPLGRPAALAHLNAFLADNIRNGRLGDIFERHGVARDCAIVPD